MLVFLERRKIGFSKIYRYENLTIDTEKMIIKMDDTLIELSKKEYELILYMIINNF